VSRLQRADLWLTWSATRRLGAVSAALARPFVTRLWFMPWKTTTSATAAEREAGWLAGTEPLRLRAGRRRVTGFAAGAGPTVLLVHGWGDHAARMGGFVGPLVAAGFRVVAIDLPGHGPGRPRRTDIPTQAAAIRAVADALGGVHAVIGHSLGATVTIMALRDGLAAESVVLLAPAVRLDHAVERFREMLAVPDPAIRGLRRGIERRFGATVWDDYAADTVAATLEQRALLVHDAADTQVDLADGRRLAAAWPGARLLETSGLGHQRILRDPAVVSAAVEFVAGRQVKRQPERAVAS